jgi:putative hydrolase of the HAD superfamily
MGVSLPSELVRQIVEMEHRALAGRLEVPQENLQVLAALREYGLRLGLVSNAHFLPDMMQEDIERLGIAQYLDDAVFSAQIGVRKPHPAIFMKVLNELSVVPREAIFVGDRLNDDIGGAQRLGMLGVLTHQFRQEDVDGSSIKPNLVVKRLSEVVPYVLERLATESVP